MQNYLLLFLGTALLLCLLSSPHDAFPSHGGIVPACADYAPAAAAYPAARSAGNGVVDIQDILSFVAPVRRLDTSPGSLNFNPAWDRRLGPEAFSQWINIQDLIDTYIGHSVPFKCEGRVRFMFKMTSPFDAYALTQAGQQHASTHYAHASMFRTHSDAYSWYQGESDFLRNAYGLSRPDQSGLTSASALRDAAGNICVLPDNARDASDIGSQLVRDALTQWVQASISAYPFYDGVYLDDVNLNLSQAMECPDNQPADPIDPRTGSLMTQADWARYIVEYLEGMRAALPGKVITHNTVSYSIFPYADPLRIREVKAANYIELEFGFVDQGLSNGPCSDKYSWCAKAEWVDFIHAQGSHVAQQAYWHGNPVDTSYALANYLLLSDGRDYFLTFQAAYPDSWASLYETDLGPALGSRYPCGTEWCRDFEGGQVRVNPASKSAVVPGW